MLGTVLPVLRTVISIPAGFAKMRLWKFVLYSAVGSLTFNGAVAGLVLTGREVLPSQGIVTHVPRAIDLGIAHFWADRSAVSVTIVILGLSIILWRADGRRRIHNKR